jgi:hypothetical protein
MKEAIYVSAKMRLREKKIDGAEESISQYAAMHWDLRLVTCWCALWFALGKRSADLIGCTGGGLVE